MRLFKSIGSFTQKWIESWKTKPDFTFNKKLVSPKQVSKKFSFLNAFISGALGTRTLLSILVSIAGVTSVVIYDTVLNSESPMFISSDSAGSGTDNKELLSALSHMLSPPPELAVEPITTEIPASTEVQSNDSTTTNTTVSERETDSLVEISPDTGDSGIIVLFALMGISCISIAAMLKRRL